MPSAVRQYYDINKILMSKLGTWPMQSIFEKTLLPGFFMFFMFSIAFLEIVLSCLKLFLSAIIHTGLFTFLLIQFVRLLEVWKIITENCESLVIFLLAIAASVKLFIIIIKNKNIEHMLSLIDYHWRVFTHSLETQILHDYAIVGRKMIISYAVMIYSLMSLYMLMPLSSPILDLLMPLNTSRPYIYIFDVDFSFDREVYYYPVLFYSYIIVILAVSAMVITDTIYISLTQHACSLFAAIGHRLENLTLIVSLEKSCLLKDMKIICDNKCESNNDDIIYREIIIILRKHQLSLEYADLLESIFAMYSLVMIIIHVICMSLLGIQIITFLNHKAQLIRYVSIIIGGFLHLYILSYPGQEIIDHSTEVFHKAYNLLWYKMSRKTTQLLSILLYRCFVPCTLTAGKMYIMSLQNYASVMQGTLSYFTALSSFK